MVVTMSDIQDNSSLFDTYAGLGLQPVGSAVVDPDPTQTLNAGLTLQVPAVPVSQSTTAGAAQLGFVAMPLTLSPFGQSIENASPSQSKTLTGGAQFIIFSMIALAIGLVLYGALRK